MKCFHWVGWATLSLGLFAGCSDSDSGPGVTADGVGVSDAGADGQDEPVDTPEAGEDAPSDPGPAPADTDTEGDDPGPVPADADSDAADAGDAGPVEPLECLRRSATASKLNAGQWCDHDYWTYTLDPPLNRLHVAADLLPSISERTIADLLRVADAGYQQAEILFGWAFTPPLGLDHFLCPEVEGLGTGVGGTYWPPSAFGLFDPGSDGQMTEADWFGGLNHEAIHLWDFRGQLWLQGPDTAHSFTAGLEPWMNEHMGMRYIGEYSDRVAAMPAPIGFSTSYRAAMTRYLADPALDWSSYYTPEGYEKASDGTAGHPWFVERMHVQGGILMWLRRVHGEAALTEIFAGVEAIRLELGDDPWVAPSERLPNFARVIADGLQLDVRPYFEHWKFPLPADVQAYLATYPASPMVLDGDDDGYSPLEGDWDDADATVWPHAPEMPDGKDNNGDGQVDELALYESDLPGADFPGDEAPGQLTLPAYIRGTVSSLDDVEAFTFELPERSLVSVVAVGLGSDAPGVIDGGLELETWTGTVNVDGEWMASPLHWAGQIDGNTRFFEAGTHALRIHSESYAFGDPHPGHYEVRVFVNAFQPEPIGEGCGRYDFKVYQGLPADPAFDCVDANDASPQECAALVQIWEQLGGESWEDPRGWLATPDVCFWRGVRCGHEGVITLNLDWRRLASGPLGDVDWSQLPHLKHLSIRGYSASGPLPDSLLPLALDYLVIESGEVCVPAGAHQGWLAEIAEVSGPLPACP